MFLLKILKRALPLIFLASSALAQEMRGMWADAFHNGYATASHTTQLVADARTGHFNAIFVQVRKRGDAYYSNGLEPKATNVSPSSYDPLADLVSKAHSGSPRIEIHAWVVTYNIWNNETTAPTSPTHPYNLHPTWLTQKQDGTKWDGGNYGFDPGHPDVQEHTFNVCMDILNRYDIDGLHFDYIRYSDGGSSVGNQPFGYNPVAVQRFQTLYNRATVPASTDVQWLQFRRDQVSSLLRKVYLNAWKAKPAARISASLISYGNCPANQTTGAWQGSEAYGRVLQDWRGWMQEGILDLAMPMVYRNYSTSKASFDGWSSYTKDNQFNRRAAPGIGFYLNTGALNVDQINQVRTNSAAGNAAAGSVGYSYAVPTEPLTSQAAFYSQLTAAGAPYASTATVPGMPWKTDVTKGHAMGYVRDATGAIDFDGATVTFSGPQARTVKTDATGFFGAVDLPVGTYTVLVNVPGYYPSAKTLTVTGAQVAEWNLGLQELPFTITSNSWNAAQRKVTMTWTSKPQKTYRVEVSTNLQTWTPLASGVASAGYSTTYTSAAQPAGEVRQFFRVIQE